ncbi:MAG: sugar phosphate isomerase/epimerase family protein [Anaerolineae bacterium]
MNMKSNESTADLHPIGVSTASFYPHYLTEDALCAAAELGFEVVEAFLQVDAEYTSAFGAELARRQRATGVAVHSLHLYATSFDLWSAYPRMVEEVRHRFLRTLEVAAQVEARALTWHGLRYGIDNPHLVEAFLDSLAWAAEQAHAAGITLCIENVSWCYLRRPEHVEILRGTGLPLGYTFDSFQAAESNTEPTALIRAMNGQLTTVHLADFTETGPRHLPPGEGEIAWPEVLGALLDVGYDGPLIIEVAHLKSTETLVRARDFVKRKLHEIL